MHYFLYLSCIFAVISLIGFTHNTHTIYSIKYSTWSKNRLINFWVLYNLEFLSSVHFKIDMIFFQMCELLKLRIFKEIWWIINVQIFSLLLLLIWVQNALTCENTLHAEFLYHWDLYCIVLTDCAWSVCMHLFIGHIVSSLHILKERIFVFMWILNLFFLSLVSVA